MSLEDTGVEDTGVEDIEDLGTPEIRMLHEILNTKFKTIDQFYPVFDRLVRKYHLQKFGKEKLHDLYLEQLKAGKIQKNPSFEANCIKLFVRSGSGILVFTLVMSPGAFSCRWNCHYCPNEPGIARSYHSNEPAVARGKESNFEMIPQFNTRARMYESMKIPTIDKIEVILLGGTFHSYPRAYRTLIMTQIFYAANVYKGEPREMKSLEEEQTINETSEHRIIGIVIETRPDCITEQECLAMRKMGITRVQLGVQHTDPEILERVNRGHTYQDAVRAVCLLKLYGFKIDLHVMPDLPGSTPELDAQMLRTVINSGMADYIKIYPCLLVDYTEIKKWAEEGIWTPYAETDPEALIRILIDAKETIPEYIRINRLQRDFLLKNNNVQLGYDSKTHKPHLRDILHRRMKAEGKRCRCIRCREIGDSPFDPDATDLVVREYQTVGLNGPYGHDYFISIETQDPDPAKVKLIGFIRLFFPPRDVHPRFAKDALDGSALIRELHVYGRMKSTGSSEFSPQHHGIGTRLLRAAEEIAVQNGYTRVAIISGVGVRKFYEKRGYRLMSTYMVRDFQKRQTWTEYLKSWIGL